VEIAVLCSPVGVLSDRELEVLAIVAEDKTDREIASRLVISERTVRAHVSRIIRKLGVASRVGAAVVFVEWKVRVEVPADPSMVACHV
jgi:DNA-binding CsgD family transcriptional regulator